MDEQRRHDRLTPAASLLPDGLGSVGGDLGRIVGAWPAIVGDRLARTTTPSRLSSGTLHVRCASASWAQSLNGIELQLLERIAARLGSGVVTRVHARAGGPAPRVEEEPRRAPLPELSSAEQAHLDELVAGIDDPDLRARLRAAAAATARRRHARDDR